MIKQNTRVLTRALLFLREIHFVYYEESDIYESILSKRYLDR